MKKTAKGTPILKHSAKPTEKNESVKWVLRLYVAGQTKKSLAALSNLKKICEEHLAGSYKIELIDILKHPLRSKGDQILAIPTLIRKLPAQNHRGSLRYRTSIDRSRFAAEVGRT